MSWGRARGAAMTDGTGEEWFDWEVGGGARQQQGEGLFPICRLSLVPGCNPPSSNDVCIPPPEKKGDDAELHVLIYMHI